MSDDTATKTPQQMLRETVPHRIAGDLNEWAQSLKDGNPQTPVLQRLAETIDDVPSFMEPRPAGSIAVMCLRAHDTIEGAVIQALGAPFPAAYTSADVDTPVDDRDDSYYLGDIRFAQVMEGIKATSETENDSAPWDVSLKRGLNRVCTGRRKGDPVRTVFEIVIELVTALANDAIEWPNKATKDFVTSAKDRVRSMITAQRALKGPPDDGAVHSEGDEFGDGPILDPPGSRAAAPPAPAAPPPPTGGPKPTTDGKGQPQDGNALEKLQRANADLRGQVTSLQGEMARRLAEAATDKEDALRKLRTELEGKLNDMEDQRDRAKADLETSDTEVTRLKAIESKFETLSAAHEALKASKPDTADLQTRLEAAETLNRQLATEFEEAKRNSSERALLLDSANETIHGLRVGLEEASQKLDEQATKLAEADLRIGNLNRELEEAQEASSLNWPEPATPPRAPISSDRLAEFQDFGEMVAKIGGLIIKAAQRPS